MKRGTKIILLLILILAGLFTFRYFNTRPSLQKQPLRRGGVDKVMVKVMLVERADLNLILSYVGSIKAKDEINVFSKVPGKLVEYTVNEGDRVDKGQGIVLIDRDETGLKYELAKVEAPISGIVGRTLLDKGANVLAGAGIASGTPLAILVNMDEMIVRLNVPEQDIPYLKKGLKAKVQVDAYPDENFPGEVSRVSEIVDPQTRTLPIEITISNGEHKLKSGMFSRIKIIASQLKDRLVILQDALVQELGVNYAFVVQDHTAKKRRVTIGIREDSRIEILDGLKDSEQVIVFGQQGLKDGTSVEVVQE